MASDCGRRRKPLYADLFKTPVLVAPEKGGGERLSQQSSPPAVSWNSSSSGSSSWTQSLLSCDSSSSGLSTPMYSELGSSGSEDSDFIGELTRQMAECMLQEDDDDQPEQLSNNESRDDDPTKPPIQVYEVKNQPKTGRRRRVKGKGTRNEATQQQYPQFGGYGMTGSGMQAVYLGGSGYGYGYGSVSQGTGVFLPRVSQEPDAASRDAVQLRKKKSGYPMVLIPTRVLQVLEHHFNRIQDSNYPRVESSSRHNNGADDDDDCGEESHDEGEKISENNEGMMAQLLPKEWTY